MLMNKMFYKISLVFLLTVSTSNCTNYFCFKNIKETDENLLMTKAVVKIIQDFYISHGSYCHVISSVSRKNHNKLNDLITEVMKVTKTVVQIENVEKNLTSQVRKRYSVLVFADSMESFLKFHSKLSSNDFKFRRFFTVVMTDERPLSEVEKIFDLFWKLSIKNVNLILRHNSGDIDLFTYFPFTKTKKCGETTAVKINNFNKDLGGWNSKSFHPVKVKNLQKCQIIIGCAVGTAQPWLINDKDKEISGIEKDIFMELSKYLNFDPKFENHGTSPGSVFENGSATGKELFTNDVKWLLVLWTFFFLLVGLNTLG